MNPRHEALAAGQIKYQGTPCKYGHSGIRYSSNANCVDCAAEWDVARGRSNPFQSARVIARKAGEMTYQGPVCRRGHSGTRYVSSACCVECAAINGKRQREEARAAA